VIKLAQCNDLFFEFNDSVKLNPQKKNSLRISRNTLREKIRKYFKETLKTSTPKFYGQGSYMMNTTITPIEGEYDIDDGIYLQHLSKEDEDNWNTPSTVHSWIVNATKDHTSTAPINKNTCVRVVYKDDYHIDFPIYIKSENDEHPKLAHLKNGWVYSDPKELTNWFNKEVKNKGSQLKRVVRYFKAWKDFKKGDNKFPSGMIFTVLAAKYFVEGYEEDDDAAYIATAQEIYEKLNQSFSIERPVFPEEELLEGWSDSAQNKFLNKLSNMIEKGQEALEVEDKETASNKWIKIFGDRFPKYEPPEEEMKEGYAMKTSKAAVLGNYGRSS
jgi:hypothetical protein